MYPDFLLEDLAYNYLDMNTQTCSFDSEDFRKDLEVFDTLNIYSWKLMHERGYHNDLGTVLSESLFCRYYYSSGEKFSNPFYLAADYNRYKPENPIMFGRKDAKTEGYIAHANLCFAINVNSDKKDMAYKYLKLLLSEEFQTEPLSFYSNFGIPILNRVRVEYLDMIFREELPKNHPPQYSIPLDETGNALIDKYIEICENVTSCYMVDGKWRDEIFNPLRKEYVEDGKITADQFAQTLQQKTNIFLKE
jgi:hypothetical protein